MDCNWKFLSEFYGRDLFSELSSSGLTIADIIIFKRCTNCVQEHLDSEPIVEQNKQLEEEEDAQGTSAYQVIFIFSFYTTGQD